MKQLTILKKPVYRRRRVWLISGYALLLVFSGIYRYRQPEESISQDKIRVFLNTVDDGRAAERRIRATYKEFLPETESGELPVILLHGSPGDAGVFDGIATFFNSRRLISIDLPGFGDSEKDLPDYSIKAHARYVLELMDALKIEKAHIAGFSLGGGVAIEMNEAASDRVASISLISSIGVQDYELFGNYYVNHALHGAQLVFFWSLQELTPNFGVFEGAIPYARNFFDTDQRPLRGILETTAAPILIIHGKEDPLVPVEAAREHFRLAPQSEMIEIDDDHFMVFMRPEKIARPLEDFLRRVEDGTAATRSTANPERIIKAGRPFQPEIIVARGVTGALYFLFISIAAFALGDFGALAAGILSAQGRFGFSFSLAAALFGAIPANLAVYLAGRFFGREILLSAPFRFFFKRSETEKLSARLARDSSKAIFLSRLVTGAGLTTCLTAGTLPVGFVRFTAAILLSVAIRIGLVTAVSYTAAGGLARFSLTDLNNTPVLFAVVFAAYISFRFLRKRLI